MKRLRLGVVGVGHLGKEHARILASLTDVELVGVVDPRAEQAEAVARRCGTRPLTSHHDLVGEVDGVVIAAPTTHHHRVALDFLDAGVPLLIEKPLTRTLAEADELVERAQARGAFLQVGHIERFNPAFEAIASRRLQPKFIQCRRYSPYSGRSTDIGVVLDMMIHDLDLLLALVGEPVVAVTALGLTLLGGQEDVAQAQLTFADGCVAHLQASRVWTGPMRQTEVWAPEGLISLDYHTRRVTLTQRSPLGHFLDKAEWDCSTDGPDQLTRELLDFTRALRTGLPPRVTGEQGRDVVALSARILDAVAHHPWTGRVEGPTGPLQLPPPLAPLIPPAVLGRAA